MTAIIFATGATTNALTGEVLSIDHATVERRSNGLTEVIEIKNRSGQTLCLDLDAARQLAYVFTELLKPNL